MSKKAPPPAFEVVFLGSEVYPEKVPLGVLARTLSAIQRLATGLEGDEDDELHDASIRLLNVARGSAVYRFVGEAPAAAILRLRSVGEVIESPDAIGTNDYMLNPLERLSATAKSLGCQIVVREPGKDGPVLATIEPASFDRVSKSLFICGETSITGEVVRVGGATDVRCALRVPFQNRLLYCTVEKADVARKLGEVLYRKVVAQGKATWIKSTWKVHSFLITNAHELKKASLREAFTALRDAGGSDWDAVEDPEEFLNEVTGD